MFFEIKNYPSMKNALDSLCDFLSENDVHSDSVFDSRLAACELLGNVLRHEDNAANFRYELENGVLKLTILSKSPFLPESVSLPDLFSEHGRGIFLVHTVSENGIEPIEQGKGVLIRIKIRRKE